VSEGCAKVAKVAIAPIEKNVNENFILGLSIDVRIVRHQSMENAAIIFQLFGIMHLTNRCGK
jgi:hypothetical protein